MFSKDMPVPTSQFSILCIKNLKFLSCKYDFVLGVLDYGKNHIWIIKFVVLDFFGGFI